MIELKKVDETNWREVIEIEVEESQKAFIESNSESLLEAAYDTHLNWHPFGVYQNDRCVGFIMVGAYNADEKFIWLDRIMLAKEHQGKGWGSKVLDRAVKLIVENWVVDEIVLSVSPDNEGAINFYKTYGFELLDRIDPANGELMMRLLV